MTTNPFTKQVVENAFCATGKGGGVDPTCGKGKGNIPDATKQTYRVAWTPFQHDPVVGVSIQGDEEAVKLATDRTPLNVQVVTEPAMTYKEIQKFLDRLADAEFNKNSKATMLLGDRVDSKRITTT